ncbi:MAG: hypothetical protein MK136_12845, partial [Pirellulaceae bacterium]|nr:hypothetical protein [Pirellulaceae bacterium]
MVDSSPYDGVFWPIFGGGLAVSFVMATAAALSWRPPQLCHGDRRSFVMATAAAWSRGFLIPL